MTLGAPREGWRRAIHLASGSLGFAAYALPMTHRTMSLILLALFLALVLLEIARRALPAVERVFEVVTLGAVRPAETQGRILGGTTLALGYLLAWLLFPAAAAAPAILVTASADPAAAAVGTAVTRNRGRKTIAGSLAALVVALAVLLLTRSPLPAALAAALAATLAERVPGAGADNVLMPLATAAALALLT